MVFCEIPNFKNFTLIIHSHNIQRGTPGEVIRATTDEKEAQIATRNALQERNQKRTEASLKKVQEAALRNENMFEALMEATKTCSLGQITNALFAVGGQYRRNM